MAQIFMPRVMYNRMALHNAVERERLHTVEWLLQNGADVNAQTTGGNTSLIEAAWNTDVNVARVLLTYGANPNLQEASGNTALHFAVRSLDITGVIPELLAHGADPNLQNNDGETPLMLAQKMERPDLVELLRGGAER